jgi:hypothetical protein
MLQFMLAAVAAVKVETALLEQALLVATVVQVLHLIHHGLQQLLQE